ncbi:NmrA/HSCARG family protein [soil metagenome]
MDATTDGPILVTGATGKQGGAVARRLLDLGRKVRVLTRDRSHAADLAARGAEVMEGDLTDRSTLDRALAGASGVYAMTTPFEAGMEAEIEQGKTLAEAAQSAGIEPYVFSSVGSADAKTGIPHFESKARIEEHLRDAGFALTILRPVFFMENLLAPQSWSAIQNGTLGLPLRPETPLAMVAVDDIGAFGAAAFERPDDFVDETIELAGDERTMTEVAEILSRALGHRVEFQPIPIPAAREAMGDDLATMFEWFEEVGYEVDPPALRQRYGIPLTDFEKWVERTEWPS